MPVDFDDADIEEVVEEVNDPQAQVLPQEPDFEPDLEEQMSEVEARLEMAQYYRLLLQDSIFEDPPSPEVASRVEEEIRGFIRSRMQVLVGVGEPPASKAQKIFTDAEVQALRTIAQPDVVEALKALAAKVLKKPTILDAKPLPAEKPKAEPTVIKEPILRKRRQPNAPAPVQAAPQRTVGGRSKPQKKVLVKETNDDGKEFVRDLTPQARPVGNIQPIPTPRTREQIEIAAATSASHQAAVALKTLEKTLRGKE